MKKIHLFKIKLNICFSVYHFNFQFSVTPISTVTTTEFKRAIGDPITLICSTRANPAATEWVWTKDGTTLPNHNAVSLLVDMDSTQDLGTYSCVAKNTVGQSSIIEFHVKQQDQTTSMYPFHSLLVDFS